MATFVVVVVNRWIKAVGGGRGRKREWGTGRLADSGPESEIFHMLFYLFIDNSDSRLL